ncbi:Ig-like domain-containing protein [Blautia sp. HCP28S3_G10]|uniref:Ig-like domain-containing protein n=1 Tax=Blautia sp. HCP28S3_G10 TaxID=3438908 RepID=UPI003F8927CC
MKKIIVSILLSAVMIMGSMPVSTMAADEVGISEETMPEVLSEDSSEGAESGDESLEEDFESEETVDIFDDIEEITDLDVSQEIPATTEVPATEIPAQPADESELLASGGSTETSETPATTADPTTESGITINIGGTDTAFATLAEAVNKAKDISADGTETVIKVTKSQEIENTVTIDSSKISIVSGAADVKFTRKDGFTGKMFDISGNAEVAFKGDTANSFTLTLDGTVTNAAADSKTDTLVSVGTGSTFQMTSGVTLTNNAATADDVAGAITNNGGTLKLEGGTITANTGVNGGVYTTTSVEVKGDISVSGNKDTSAEPKDMNINFGAENMHLIVTGELTGTGKVYVTVPTEKADTTVVAEIGKDGETPLVTNEQFAKVKDIVYYDDASYAVKISDSGDTAILTAQTSPTAAPPTTTQPTAAPTTSTPTTAAPTTATTSTFKPSISGVAWLDHKTLQFKLKANQEFSYYYTIGKKTYDESKATRSVKADTKDVVTVSDIPEGSNFQIYVYFKLADGTHKYARIPISSTVMSKRPGTENRDAKTYKVSDCTVSGLEDAKKFYPGVFYEFAVTGAGQDNKDPVVGDEKYVPLYWSTSKTPTDSQKNDKWKVGFKKGITKASTYNMYVFFRKYRYDGSEWIKTDTIEYKTVQYRSAQTTNPKLNANSIILKTGQSTTAVKVKNQTAVSKVTAWFSADTSVARVNKKGKITAGNKTGKTTITAVLSDGKMLKLKVTVQSSTVRTKSIKGLKKSVSLANHKRLKLKPVLNPISSQEKITYASSNTKIATVNRKGVISAKKPGTVNITVKSGNSKFVVKVKITKIKTTKLKGVPTDKVIKKGKTFKIKASREPKKSDEKITYKSSNSKIATVNAKGVVKGRKKGTATITVKSGSKKSTCKVTVK